MDQFPPLGTVRSGGVHGYGYRFPVAAKPVPFSFNYQAINLILKLS
jgi:hypothetical protein